MNAKKHERKIRLDAVQFEPEPAPRAGQIWALAGTHCYAHNTWKLREALDVRHN